MTCAGLSAGVDTICVLSLLLVLFLAPKGFFRGTSVFHSHYNPLTLTSPFDINVPPRGSSALETKGSFVLVVGTFE